MAAPASAISLTWDRLTTGEEHGQKYTLQQEPYQLGKDSSKTTSEPKFLYTLNASRLNWATRKFTITLTVSSTPMIHLLGSFVPIASLPIFTLMILLCM